jgi:hypothetical protein
MAADLCSCRACWPHQPGHESGGVGPTGDVRSFCGGLVHRHSAYPTLALVCPYNRTNNFREAVTQLGLNQTGHLAVWQVGKDRMGTN